MSTDRTREIVADYAQKFSFIKMIDNLDRIVPPALNKGVAVSNGDIIIRLDAHATYEPNYFSVLVKYLQKLNADNVGSVCRTDVLNKTPKTLAIKEVLSSKLGVGNSTFRTGINKVAEVDTVPFGCYKKDVFDRIGLFDEDLIRNQDDEFNARLINSGGKIYLIPELIIDYIARDSVLKLKKMYYQYGLFKPLVNKKLGKPATIRQFFPLLFVVGLFCGLILSFCSFFLMIIYLLVLLFYFGMGLFVGANLAIKEIKSKFFWMAALFLFFIFLYEWPMKW
jgi:glycosyltransferase involved in cell wall biosynthesis